jgi:hypothetical protein
MSTDWPVREIGVRENWKCASVKLPKPEESKRWGMMMSPGGDVDPRILKWCGLQTSLGMTWTHRMCATC